MEKVNTQCPGMVSGFACVLDKGHIGPHSVSSSIPLWPEPEPTDKKSVLSEAGDLVYGPRGEDYGHPFDDFKRTAKMWSAILGIEIRAEQVGMCMIALKLSRQCNKPKRDNLIDIAGYAATIDMVLDRVRELLQNTTELKIDYIDDSLPYR